MSHINLLRSSRIPSFCIDFKFRPSYENSQKIIHRFSSFELEVNRIKGTKGEAVKFVSLGFK